MKALILAAGYATRLYPLTKDTPKPLLKLQHQPIIDYTIDQIEHLGDVDEIIIVTNDRFYGQFNDWLEPKLARNPYRYKLLNDGSSSVLNKRGAIGDIKFVIETQNVNEDLLVIGGDTLFDFNLSKFVDFAYGKVPFHSLCLYLPERNHLNLSQYGIAQLKEDSRVASFEEKPEYPKSNLIGTCIYFFPKEKLRLIKEYDGLGLYNDTLGFYIQWLTENDRVYGKIFDGTWFDIGDFDSLSQAVIHINGRHIEVAN